MAGEGKTEDEGALAPGAAATSRDISRRDFARYGLLAGGMVWSAPKVTSIRFAQQVVGSHPPSTTTVTEPPPETTTTTGGGTTTTTTTEPPATTTTTAPPGSTTTTGPPGSTTPQTIGPASTSTTAAPGSTTSTTSAVGPQTTVSNGSSTTTPNTTVPPTTPSNTQGGSKGGSDPEGSGIGGVLSFTGADSADLAVLGATAIVVGRALYAFARRPAEEESVPD